MTMPPILIPLTDAATGEKHALVYPPPVTLTLGATYVLDGPATINAEPPLEPPPPDPVTINEEALERGLDLPEGAFTPVARNRAERRRLRAIDRLEARADEREEKAKAQKERDREETERINALLAEYGLEL
jgi:hypothetical protein